MQPLFRAAAGPRIGFGHLVRARVLARALEVSHPVLSLRGGDDARKVARRLGFTIVSGDADRALRRLAPDVTVVDDPSSAPARAWRSAARRQSVPVASIHDLGRAFCAADLTIDGSLTATAWAHDGTQLLGPRFAVIDPGVARARGRRRMENTVLVALGGGAQAEASRAIGRAIRSLCPDAEIRIAGGFTSRTPTEPGMTWLPALPGLADELATCAVAVVGGGISLYESAVLATPTVMWPVVRAQHPTVTAFARAGHGHAVLPGRDRIARAARAVADLLEAPPSGRRAISALDGNGAGRVAAAIVRLAARRHARGSTAASTQGSDT